MVTIATYRWSPLRSLTGYHQYARPRTPAGRLHYTLESNATDGDEPPERLTLGFPTADVVLFGARLGPLVEKLHLQSLTAVMTLDARYAHALGQNPWVARIVVSRIDKQGGAA